MTWKEFKDYVEQQGVEDGDEILYIDITGMNSADSMTIVRGSDKRVLIN